MNLVKNLTTEALTIGDSVQIASGTAVVVALIDTGRTAIFGTGTMWAIDLDGQLGRREMTAPSSHVWTVA